MFYFFITPHLGLIFNVFWLTVKERPFYGIFFSIFFLVVLAFLSA
jgi:hypothetical protein